MADFSSIEDEQEFLASLDELDQTEESAVAVADREDQQAQKQAQAKKAEREEGEVVTKAEYMTDKFLASASEHEKTLFGIYAHGADTPEQVRRAIELARTNAAEAAKLTQGQAEEQAEKIAEETYGISPVQNAGPSRKLTPQEEFDLRRQKAIEKRDEKEFFRLFNDLPPDAE